MTNAERKGMNSTHVCSTCERLYRRDTQDWAKMEFTGDTKYYSNSGNFTKCPKLIRQITCSFQGLRKLTIQKPLSTGDAFQKALEEGRRSWKFITMIFYQISERCFFRFNVEKNSTMTHR